MQFFVRTLAPDLSIGRVVVNAADAIDARRQVEARGLVVSGVEPGRASPPGGHAGKFSLVLFSQEVLALLSAGLSIVEALEALLEKESASTTREALQRLLDGLREGKRFSAVLAEQPGLFPALYIGIVRAAENTSDLPRSLSRFVEYRARVDAVRAKIISAAIYPAILLAVGSVVSLFLIGYVVPRFADVYQGAGRSLPLLSQIMLDWGQFASRHSLSIALFFAAAVVSAGLGVRRMIRRGGIASMAARIPRIGERVRIYELSRVYLTLGMLSEGGIPLVHAVDTVHDVVSPALQKRLEAAKASIESGMPMSSAFEANGLTTPISLRMLRVGERTGEMGPMLMQSAAFYDGEISRWIDRFTRTFEPLLMAAIGIVVGAIVVLLYMPIFDLAGDMS